MSIDTAPKALFIGIAATKATRMSPWSSLYRNTTHQSQSYYLWHRFEAPVASSLSTALQWFVYFLLGVVTVHWQERIIVEGDDL